MLALRISADVIMLCVIGSSGQSSSLLYREFKRPVQGIHKLIDLDWFREIPEESGLQTLFDVARHSIRTERDYGNVRGQRVLAKDFERFNTADSGQIDIHQDDLRMMGPRELYAQI